MSLKATVTYNANEMMTNLANTSGVDLQFEGNPQLVNRLNNFVNLVETEGEDVATQIGVVSQEIIKKIDNKIEKYSQLLQMLKAESVAKKMTRRFVDQYLNYSRIIKTYKADKKEMQRLAKEEGCYIEGRTLQAQVFAIGDLLEFLGFLCVDRKELLDGRTQMCLEYFESEKLLDDNISAMRSYYIEKRERQFKNYIFNNTVPKKYGYRKVPQHYFAHNLEPNELERLNATKFINPYEFGDDE